MPNLVIASQTERRNPPFPTPRRVQGPGVRVVSFSLFSRRRTSPSSAPQMLGGRTPRATPQARSPRPLTCQPAPPVCLRPGQDQRRAFPGHSLSWTVPGCPPLLGAPHTWSRVWTAVRAGGRRSGWAQKKAAVGEDAAVEQEGRESCGPGGLKVARSLLPRVPRSPCLTRR